MVRFRSLSCPQTDTFEQTYTSTRLRECKLLHISKHFLLWSVRLTKFIAAKISTIFYDDSLSLTKVPFANYVVWRFFIHSKHPMPYIMIFVECTLNVYDALWYKCPRGLFMVPSAFQRTPNRCPHGIAIILKRSVLSFAAVFQSLLISSARKP